MQRLVMYTQQYIPLGVLNVTDDEIDILRRNPGHAVQHAMVPPVSYTTTATIMAAMQVFAVRLKVEGMRWADGVTRRILVAHGLSLDPRRDEGTDLQRVAQDIWNATMSQLFRDRNERQARGGDRGIWRRALDRVAMWQVDATQQAIERRFDGGELSAVEAPDPQVQPPATER